MHVCDMDSSYACHDWFIYIPNTYMYNSKSFFPSSFLLNAYTCSEHLLFFTQNQVTTHVSIQDTANLKSIASLPMMGVQSRFSHVILLQLFSTPLPWLSLAFEAAAVAGYPSLPTSELFQVYSVSRVLVASQDDSLLFVSD
mmetsp:Transcript_97678/g.142946  ORF Transcript_97678/g.142946 Transcript_97678/m.142946 type:complete len:141 (+) Transcript_97678:291-713(+)